MHDHPVGNFGGEVMFDYTAHGDAINTAARLESAAQPGGICVTETVHQQVAGKVTLEFVDGGTLSHAFAGRTPV